MSDPSSRLSVIQQLKRLQAFCEQVAADGYLPSQAWFAETAQLLAALLPALREGQKLDDGLNLHGGLKQAQSSAPLEALDQAGLKRGETPTPVTNSLREGHRDEQPSGRIEQEKHCCSVCDAKKRCHVCGAQTLYACSDCRIDFGVSIYVCTTTVCRNAHEEKCSARLRAASVSSGAVPPDEPCKDLRAGREASLIPVNNVESAGMNAISAPAAKHGPVSSCVVPPDQRSNLDCLIQKWRDIIAQNTAAGHGMIVAVQAPFIKDLEDLKGEE